MGVQSRLWLIGMQVLVLSCEWSHSVIIIIGVSRCLHGAVHLCIQKPVVELDSFAELVVH